MLRKLIFKEVLILCDVTPALSALCRKPIPEPGNYTERNVTAWHGWRHPGAVVEYTCHTGAVQTATCTGAGWEPLQLPPCCEFCRDADKRTRWRLSLDFGLACCVLHFRGVKCKGNLMFADQRNENRYVGYLNIKLTTTM